MLAVTWRNETETRRAINATQRRTEGVFGVNIVVDPKARDIPTETHVEICLDEGIDILSFSFGEAAPYVERIGSQAGTILQSVGSAEEAKNAVDTGVDIVVAQGWEAGDTSRVTWLPCRSCREWLTPFLTRR